MIKAKVICFFVGLSFNIYLIEKIQKTIVKNHNKVVTTIHASFKTINEINHQVHQRNEAKNLCI